MNPIAEILSVIRLTLTLTLTLIRGPPNGWLATNRCQADISDRHLFDFQLVASDYTDCPLRYTRLSFPTPATDLAMFVFALRARRPEVAGSAEPWTM